LYRHNIPSKFSKTQSLYITLYI